MTTNEPQRTSAGRLGKGERTTLSTSHTTSRLASLADLFIFFSPTPIFSPFSHNAEPGPKLINTRILKFKSQLTFALFVAVNHLSGPLKKQRLTSGGFRSVLCASVFQGSLLVIVIVIDGREKRNCEGGFLNFRIRVFLKSVVRNFL